MSTPKKPINEYTNDELEKLELQLWRAKHETSERLAAITNDLAVVNGMLSERTKSDDTDGQVTAP
jgi:hypothetical protein